MNKLDGRIQAGSPLAGPRTAASSRAFRRMRSVMQALAGMLLGLSAPGFAQTAPAPTALPSGGRVVAGEATIQQSGATMTVNQGTDRSAVDWNTFNVGSGSQVNFVQPSSSSVILNRVQGNEASQIFGRINANGQVFLSNPNGVFFAPGASVDVAGLVATTHRIGLDDFMAGRYRFDRDGATGSVINQGELRAALGGYIALLAPEVRNQGVIIANLGTVALAAGEMFELQFDGANTLASLRVTPSAIKALVDNQGAVLAPGGLVILSAQALSALQGGVVRSSGPVEATGLAQRGGRLVLDASDDVRIGGRLDVSSAQGIGGSITVTGRDIALADGARIDATGATGGGQVLIGGDWQGSGDLRQATTVAMQAGAQIDVSATTRGDGGKAVLWSNVSDAQSSTTVSGSITAAGAGGGAGGQVETSGHALSVDASARVTTGAGGQWLLDPANVTISSSADGNYSTSNNPGVLNTLTPNNGATTATINATTLVNALNAGGEVRVTTANNVATDSSNGNITIAANTNLTKTSGADSTLTLQAERDITVEGGVTIGSNTNKLNLVLISDWDSTFGGAIYLNGTSAPININTNGGHVWMGGNGYSDARSTTTWRGLTVATGAATSNGTTSIWEAVNLNNARINTAGGSFFARGLDSRYSTNDRYGVLVKGGTVINTGSGDLTLDGSVRAFQGGNSPYDYGVSVDGSTLETTTGGISITGREVAGTDSSTSSAGGAGVRINASTIRSSGSSGNITIAGSVLPDTNTVSKNGVYVGKSTITSAGGSIALTGTGQSSNNSSGTSLDTGTTVSSTAGGAIALSGTLQGTWSTGTGLLLGDGPGSAAGAVNVLSTSGDISLQGTASGTAAQVGHGTVFYSSATTNPVTVRSTSGNISVQGSTTINGAGSSDASGIQFQVNNTPAANQLQVVSQTGNITLNGVNPNASASQNANGIRLTAGDVANNIRIGADGTNPYSGNILLQADSIQQLRNNAGSGSISLQSTGTVTIRSNAGSFSHLRTSDALVALSFDDDWNFGTQLGGFTLGAPTNTYSLTLSRPLTTAGPISLYGGDIALNGNLSTTNAGAGVLAKASGNITALGNRSLTTNGGAITLWSDSDATGGGYIALENHSVLDSRRQVDRSQGNTTTATGGGAITLAGGLDTDSDGRPDGMASSSTAQKGGVNFGNQVTDHNNLNTIYSGGGNVVIRGTDSADMMGINWVNGGTINAGTGTVALVGRATGTHGMELGSWRSSGTVAITAGGGDADHAAITLDGQGSSHGVNLVLTSLNSTGAGGVSIAGVSSGSGYGVSGNLVTQTASGPIAVNGGTRGVSLSGGSQLGSTAGNVSLTGNSVEFGAPTQISTTGTVTIQPAGDSFGAALSWPLSNLTLGNGVSGLTLGKPGNTADLTVASATTVAGPIALYGGNIAINNVLTATNSTITLQGSGNVTDGASGRLVADQLRLLGGAVTLDNPANAIGTLAASGVSSLTYRDSDALTLGTVGGTDGVSATGPIDIATMTGDLTIARTVATTHAGATALTLNAGLSSSAGTTTGGNLIIANGAGLSVGAGGTARLFTGGISQSTGLTDAVGTGSGRFRYFSDEAATNYTLALSPGLNAIYREQPTVSRAVADRTLIYGVTPTFTFTLGGGQNGDSYAQAFASTPTVAVGGATSGAGRPTVGSHSLSGSGGSATSQLGYAVSGGIASGTLTVNPRVLNFNAAIADKIYDGSVAATIASTTDNRIAGDVFTVTSAEAHFADANAGTTKPVTVTGVALSGADAGNYSVASTGTSSGTISQRVVTVSAGKVYDGTTALDASQITLGNLVGSQTLGVSAAQASDAHVATANNAIAAMTLVDGGNGGLAGNYALPTLNAANAPVIITPRPVSATASIGGTLSRVYDGTTAATGASVSGTVSGAAAGDTLALDPAAVTLAYDSAHVASASQIAATGTAGFTIAGTSHGSQASDYSFTAPTIAPVAAAITPRPLTATASIGGVTSRVYDGTTAAPGAGVSGTVSNAAPGDTIALTSGGVSLAYDSADVLTASQIAATGNAGFAITASGHGSQASDYSFTAPSIAPVMASITPRMVTVTGLIADDKTYDGTDTATISDWGAVATGVGAQTLTVQGSTATFDSANAGTGRTVTGSGYTLGNGSNGGLASNYQLSSTTATTTADIARAPLLVIANNDARFVEAADAPDYNGVSFSGFVHGETPAVLGGSAPVSRNQAATDTTAGTYVGVLVPDTSGLVSGNYVFSSRHGDYSILPSDQLLVRVNNSSNAYGSTPTYSINSAQYWDTNANAAVNLTSITDLGHGRFTVADGAGASASFTLTPTGAATSGAGLTSAGAYQLGASNVAIQNGQNFSNALTVVGAQTVTSVPVSASMTGGVSKVYDGTTAMLGVTVGLAGLRSGDRVAADGEGSFETFHAGSHLGYTVSGIALTGADAGNYYLNGGASLSGNDGTITPRPLTATASIGGATSRVYDGTRAASGASVSGAVLNAVAGDVFSLDASGVTLAYNSAHVLGATRIDASGSLGHTLVSSANGSLASDYSFTAPTIASTAASITPRPLQLSYTGTDKVYDGNTSATVTSTDNRIAGDVLTISQSAMFPDKNVGTDKPVNVSQIVLGGASASDYALASTQSTAHASISRLDSVTWVGGESGNWFDPANWAGGAVPDLSNVANVVIPAGVNVSFDPSRAVAPAETGPVNVERIGEHGGLILTGGTLNVGQGGITLDRLVQQGGDLTRLGPIQVADSTRGLDAGTAAALGRAASAASAATATTAVYHPVLDFVLPLSTEAPPGLDTTLALSLPTDPTLLTTSQTPLKGATVGREDRPQGDGVIVALIRAAGDDADGLLTVEVPADMALAGFGFTLPASLFADAGGIQGESSAVGAQPITLSRADGGAPPTWLSFDNARRRVTGNATRGALPVELVAVSGARRALVRIVSRGQ